MPSSLFHAAVWTNEVSATVASYLIDTDDEEIQECVRSVRAVVPRLIAVQNKLLDAATYGMMDMSTFKRDGCKVVCNDLMNRVNHPMFTEHMAEDLMLRAWQLLYTSDDGSTEAANATRRKRGRVGSQLNYVWPQQSTQTCSCVMY
jgi:hypothetical protein